MSQCSVVAHVLVSKYIIHNILIIEYDISFLLSTGSMLEIFSNSYDCLNKYLTRPSFAPKISLQYRLLLARFCGGLIGVWGGWRVWRKGSKCRVQGDMEGPLIFRAQVYVYLNCYK